MDSYSTIKGLNFSFLKKVLGVKFFLTPWGFFKPKSRITQRNLNQTQNYFTPLVSGPGRFELWKKTGGRKSRWTVPLNLCTIHLQYTITVHRCLWNVYLVLTVLVFTVFSTVHYVDDHVSFFFLLLLLANFFMLIQIILSGYETKFFVSKVFNLFIKIYFNIIYNFFMFLLCV